MRITRFSDIGIRALIYLAHADEHRALVTAAEISRQFDIPLNHMVKVVAQLARCGWIQGVRGRNGGLLLLADPTNLRLGSVLQQLQGDNELLSCETQHCQLSKNCFLRWAMAAGLRAFYETMNRYVLADLSGGVVGEQIIVMHQKYLESTVNID